MFAQLGNIKFELITYFNGLNETVSYNYAQHERIENKPILQFLGKNLQEENIKLNFHRTFCVPENELKALVEVADKAEPLKFIKVYSSNSCKSFVADNFSNLFVILTSCRN